MSQANDNRVGAIVVAAGVSRRMAGVDKIFTLLGRRPLISYCLEALDRAPEVDEVVLVLSADRIAQGRRLVSEGGWSKVREVCQGGQRRRDSVGKGLERLSGHGWIVVHDGARPFVTPGMVSRGLVEAAETGAAVAGVPVSDTIKSVDGNRLVTETLRRDGLWAVQTPQVFRRRLLAEAHRSLAGDFTDDASMVERMGIGVRVFQGMVRNIKVTTPDDLRIAEALLETGPLAGPGGPP